MDAKEKLSLLKSLHLLGQIAEVHLESLSDFLKPVALKDGTVIFEEGSAGASLFFVTQGHVRIAKRAADGSYKDLAILGVGDCFGEMALIEETPRSARAAADGECALFELGRDDLKRWLASHPQQALQFFAELVQVQSRRLRRTSNELTLLFDLSNLLLDASLNGPAFISRLIDRVLPHLEGSWSAAAYLYNEFNDENDLAASRGDFDWEALVKKTPLGEAAASAWLDDSTFHVSLIGRKRTVGHLLFHAAAPLGKEEQADIGRTLIAVSRLASSALENINFRTDETLRARLSQARAYGSSI